MLFNYFAGAIFTIQEVVIFCLVAFVIFGIVSGSILFFSKKLLNKTRKGGANKLSLGKAISIGFGLVTTFILLFFVAPTMIKDANWNRRQQSCAKQVGYESPADDNSNRATANSQAAYRDCLGV